MNLIPELNNDIINKILMMTLSDESLNKLPFNSNTVAKSYLEYLSKDSINYFSNLLDDNNSSDQYYYMIQDTLDNNIKIREQIYNELLVGWNNPKPKYYLMILKEILNGKKIGAIKATRMCWPLGLKEAKYFIDTYYTTENRNNMNDDYITPIIIKESTVDIVMNEIDLVSEKYPEYII